MKVIRNKQKKYDSTFKERAGRVTSEMRSPGTVCGSPQCTGGAAGDGPVESKEERAGLVPAAWHHDSQMAGEAEQLGGARTKGEGKQGKVLG